MFTALSHRVALLGALMVFFAGQNSGRAGETVAGYDASSVRADLLNVLTDRPSGPMSGAPLGNADNRALWDEAHVNALFTGITQAHRLFYSDMPFAQFARLVISEGAQESTGDYDLGVRPVDFADHASQGFLQVTPASVVLDYRDWGLPLHAEDGSTLLDPNQAARFDLGDPRTNVLLWGWYTKNVVVAGVSLNEWAHRDDWHIPIGGVILDYGNALFDWLAGPHNDRHKDGRNFVNYHNRVGDYFVQSNFGDTATFEQLLNTALSDDLVAVHGLPEPS